MPSIDVKCRYCALHGIDKTLSRSRSQVETSKYGEFFCNKEERDKFNSETGGHTRGKKIPKGYRRKAEA